MHYIHLSSAKTHTHTFIIVHRTNINQIRITRQLALFLLLLSLWICCRVCCFSSFFFSLSATFAFMRKKITFRDNVSAVEWFNRTRTRSHEVTFWSITRTHRFTDKENLKCARGCYLNYNEKVAYTHLFIQNNGTNGEIKRT